MQPVDRAPATAALSGPLDHCQPQLFKMIKCLENILTELRAAMLKGPVSTAGSLNGK